MPYYSPHTSYGPRSDSITIGCTERLGCIHDAGRMAPVDQRVLGAGNGKIGPFDKMLALSSGYCC